MGRLRLQGEQTGSCSKWDSLLTLSQKGADYDKWFSYGQAKTANILFSVELAEKYGQQGVKAYSLHPGTIWTNLGDHLTESDFTEVIALDKKLGNPIEAKSIAEYPFKSL